jgi:hypothetical protein
MAESTSLSKQNTDLRKENSELRQDMAEIKWLNSEALKDNVEISKSRDAWRQSTYGVCRRNKELRNENEGLEDDVEAQEEGETEALQTMQNEVDMMEQALMDSELYIDRRAAEYELDDSLSDVYHYETDEDMDEEVGRQMEGDTDDGSDGYWNSLG